MLSEECRFVEVWKNPFLFIRFIDVIDVKEEFQNIPQISSTCL